jgi:GTPase
MFGLVGLMPDYCMVIVGANMGVSRMTREHIGITLALKIPLFIVITKIDIAPKNIYEDTLNKLTQIMKHPNVNKTPIFVNEKDEVKGLAANLTSNVVAPIFAISNVNGQGLPKLKEFLSYLGSRTLVSGLFSSPSDPVEFYIDGIYQITGVGLVVAGTIKSGTVIPNMLLNLGPDKSGKFKPI